MVENMAPLRPNSSLERSVFAPRAVPAAPLLGCTPGTSINGFVRPLNSVVRQRMKSSSLSAALAACLGVLAQPAYAVKDPLCAPLRRFVASVGPDEHRELIFRTSWGGGFSDDPSTKNSISSKRCEHQGYDRAKAVCDILMKDGSVEFGNVNAMGAVVCISPDIRFPRYNDFDYGSFSLHYGSEDRGASVTVSFEKDAKIGGMVLRIVADGY
jgi:hypothetical protein